MRIICRPAKCKHIHQIYIYFLQNSKREGEGVDVNTIIIFGTLFDFSETYLTGIPRRAR